MVGVKVFVGNLSFKTTEAELHDAFKTSGKVEKVHIITTPYNRSKGYGFVEFENQVDAEKSVVAMNKKEIGGRAINVELARPQTETKEGTAPQERKPRRTFNPRPRGTGTTGTTNNNTERVERAPRSDKPRAPRRFNNNNNESNGKEEASDQPRRPRNVNNNNNNRRRYEKKEQPVEDRTPSKTMLFVANLAWKVNDESFVEFLKKEGIKFQSANVVVTRNGRSRGYGFINAENNEEQKRAMDILNKRELDGRPLNCKVANASSETPRVATTAPVTTTTTTTPAPAETK